LLQKKPLPLSQEDYRVALLAFTALLHPEMLAIDIRYLQPTISFINIKKFAICLADFCPRFGFWIDVLGSFSLFSIFFKTSWNSLRLSLSCSIFVNCGSA